MKEWIWIEGECALKSSPKQWSKYTTNLCDGEILETAKKRIQKDNPNYIFRNLRVVIDDKVK